MARSLMRLALALAVLALLAGGCARREGTSALFILEELEAASAVKDPSERVERLSIFIGNHPDHPYRFVAYSRMLETLGTEMKDEAGMEARLAEALAEERDFVARGELLLGKIHLSHGKGQDPPRRRSPTASLRPSAPRGFS